MMGIVETVCISNKKGMVKQAQKQIELKKDWGIDGDAHAGKWHRQVSLLAGESIDHVKEILPYHLSRTVRLPRTLLPVASTLAP